MESRLNSSGTSSQDSIRCSSKVKSKGLLYTLGEHQKISQEEFYSCRWSTTFLVEQETMNKNVWQTVDSYLCMQENLVKDNGHSFVLSSEKKWYSMKEDSPQGIWDKIAEWMLLEFAESGCPNSRATSPLSRGLLKSKGHGKLSIQYAAGQETIETFSYNCFCKSAQSLRSSRRNVWRVRNPSRSNGATRCGRGRWTEGLGWHWTVLYWWFRNKYLLPSSSRTFRTQSYWSFIAGQCCDSERILPIYLPYWMCV